MPEECCLKHGCFYPRGGCVLFLLLQCGAVFHGASSGSQLFYVAQVGMLMEYAESSFLEPCKCCCPLCWDVQAGALVLELGSSAGLLADDDCSSSEHKYVYLLIADDRGC
ncbi:hypothetical protein Nepgr_032308 [Nepenthes gracilis]|uniref:Uncharacterized protein n=1 Tax=Nepenthes gracilis TaxID=150966 RepID=A0AAD3Y7K4_NEPGR|nr:hypothetical protein Nepgr_032308 [Nepenthes gracilis]